MSGLIAAIRAESIQAWARFMAVFFVFVSLVFKYLILMVLMFTLS